MELFNLNREAIDTLIRRYTEASQQGNFSLADVIIANAEFMGRVIVNTCDTPISAIQMAQAFEDHIKRTLHAGMTAKGYNMGGELI